MLIDPTRAAVQEASAATEGHIAPLALALNAVKDQLAAIPGNGVPYQTHTWLHQSAKTPPQAQVLFNYLGRVSAGAQDFAPAGSTGQLGEQRDPDQPLVRELEFNAIAEDTGEGYVLRTTISWARGRISPERIDELVAHWDVALREVAALADHGVLSVGDVAPRNRELCGPGTNHCTELRGAAGRAAADPAAARHVLPLAIRGIGQFVCGATGLAGGMQRTV